MLHLSQAYRLLSVKETYAYERPGMYSLVITGQVSIPRQVSHGDTQHGSVDTVLGICLPSIYCQVSTKQTVGVDTWLPTLYILTILM